MGSIPIAAQQHMVSNLSTLPEGVLSENTLNEPSQSEVDPVLLLSAACLTQLIYDHAECAGTAAGLRITHAQ